MQSPSCFPADSLSFFAQMYILDEAQQTEFLRCLDEAKRAAGNMLSVTDAELEGAFCTSNVRAHLEVFRSQVIGICEDSPSQRNRPSQSPIKRSCIAWSLGDH